MFDSSNKSNTQVKQINVTEARANFATILSDTTSRYVITKNNKPQRVIINFEDFQKLQTAAGGAEETSPDEAKALDADRAKKPRPTKSIKGIIAQQFELSQHQVAETAREDEDFSFDKIKPLSPEEKKPPRELITEAEALPFDLLEEMSSDGEGLVAADATLAAEGDYFQNAEELTGVEPEATTLVLPVPEEDLAETSVQQVCTDDGAARTPEEAAYFRRYRKLYENNDLAVVAPRSLWEALPDPVLPRQRMEADSGAAEEILRQQEDAYQQMRSELEFVAVTNKSHAEEFVAEPASTTDFRSWNDSFAISSGAIDPPRAPNEASQNPSAADEGGEEVLPSLQELLKELDKERLSGEEGEPLDNKDIDELISRITSD